MGTHPIFESDFDCLTDVSCRTIFRTLVRMFSNHLYEPSFSAPAKQISQVVKVDFAVRDGAGYRPLDTLQMRGGDSFLITKRGAKIECGGSVRFVPRKVCTRFVALRIRIVKSEG